MGSRCRKFKEDYVADETLARMRLHQKTVGAERLTERLRLERWRARLWAAGFVGCAVLELARVVWM